MKAVPYKIERQRLHHDLKNMRKVMDSCVRHGRWVAARECCERVGLLIRHLQLLEIQRANESES